MPIYEYECESCGRRTEAIQRFDDPPLTTCEACQGDLKKLVSAPSFQFKGTGWYVTDYAEKGKSATNGKAEAAEGSEKAAESGESAASGDGDGGAAETADGGAGSSRSGTEGDSAD